MTRNGQEKQRFFKGVALVLGCLIFAGMILVIYGMVKRTGELGKNAPAHLKLGEKALDLPTGARVLSTSLDEGRILLRVALAGGNERLYVVDMATGNVLATLDIVEGG